jgi:transposase
MRFVALRSAARLDRPTLHRVRQRLVGVRRTLLNQLRAILFERGHAFPQGRRQLAPAVDALLADRALASSARRQALALGIRAEGRDLDRRIEALNGEFGALARQDATARRLTPPPGVGVLAATGLIAAAGDGNAFRRGRDLGAWRGLVPRQHTTGGKPKRRGIGERGTKELRVPLVHEARATPPSLSAGPSPPGARRRGMLAGAYRDVVIVVRATKLAGIAWAILRRQGDASCGARPA